MISFSVATPLSSRVPDTQNTWQMFAEGLKTCYKYASQKKKAIENVFKHTNMNTWDNVHTSLFPMPKSLLTSISMDWYIDQNREQSWDYIY